MLFWPWVCPDCSLKHYKGLFGNGFRIITPAQIQVAAYDQQVTGKKFSEVIVDRGWIKQQTIDFLIKHVINPEQRGMRSAGVFAQPIEPFEQVYARRQHEVLNGANHSEDEVHWTVD